MYENGRGVPQDFEEAVAWSRKAADQGHAKAQFNLGVLYNNGQGVPQDFKEAVAWYRKAADQGNADAQFNLGVSYAKSQGVPDVPVIAYALLNLAAAADSSAGNNAKARDLVAKTLSPRELEAGQDLSRELSTPGRFLETLDRYVAQQSGH